MTSRTGRCADVRRGWASARTIALAASLAWSLLAGWALAIGRYGGPDEPAHVTRAAAVADGQVRGAPVERMAGGFRAVTVPATLAAGDPSCYRNDARAPAACADTGDRPGTVRVATAAGINPPTYYALVGVPVRLLGMQHDTLAYRLVALTWHALAFALVVWRARRRSPLPIVSTIAVVALVTPATWFLLGVVNPNALEVALCALAWVSARDVLDADRRDLRACLWTAVPLAAAVAVRPVAVLAAAAVAAVIAVTTRGTRELRWVERLALGGPVALAAAAVAAWDAWVALAFDDPRAAVPGSRWHLLGESLRGVPGTAREMVGSAGWLEYRLPAAAQLVWWLAAALAIAGVLRCADRRRRAAFAAWLVVLVLAPVAFEVSTAGRVGLIWQGRYSLPMLAGLLLFGLERLSAPTARTAAVAAIAVPALVLGELTAYWATLRRYTVGAGGSWWFAPSDLAPWLPVVPAGALLAAHAALVIGLAVAALRTLRTAAVGD